MEPINVFHTGVKTIIYVDVTNAEKRIELREALGRALNTWTDAPEWLVRLYDELSKEQHHADV